MDKEELSDIIKGSPVFNKDGMVMGQIEAAAVETDGSFNALIEGTGFKHTFHIEPMEFGRITAGENPVSDLIAQISTDISEGGIDDGFGAPSGGPYLAPPADGPAIAHLDTPPGSNTGADGNPSRPPKL